MNENHTITCYAAPMESLTTWVYRRTQAECFGAADKYFTPFLSPVSDGGFNRKELAEILPEHNDGLRVVPQILTAKAGDFLWAAKECRLRGYEEVNLNIGCPSGTVVSKKKGAGMLEDPKKLDAFLEEIFSGFDGAISVKTRLGLTSAEEFPAILEVLNRYPILELTVHARVRKAFYNGVADTESYEKAAADARMPLVYNGDVFRVKDAEKILEKVPATKAVMVGRGLQCDPSLIRQIRGGDALTKEELRRFCDRLAEGYLETMKSEQNVMGRMKEHWHYMVQLFTEPLRYEKELRKAKRFSEFMSIVNRLFREQEIAEGAAFSGAYLK